MVKSTDDPEPAQALRGTVLYVEDVPFSFDHVDALLSQHPGVRLINAATGQQGVAMALSERPDAILLDMNLPDISGTEVVRQLSIEIAAGSFRVILLTAEPYNIDVVKAMSLGAFEYLTKPVTPLALQSALGRALGAKKGKPNSGPSGA